MVWSFLGQTVSYVIMFSSSIALARMLTPQDMGVFAFGFAIWSIASQAQNLGLPGYIVSERQLPASTLGTVFLLNSIVSSILFLLVIAIWLLLETFERREIGAVLIILAPMALFRIFDLLPYSLLHRRLMFREMAWVQVSQALVGSIVAVTLASFGFGFVSMAWGNLLGSFAAMLVAIIAGWPAGYSRSSKTAFRDVGRYGLRMFFVLGIENLSSRFNDIFIGHLQGYALLGFYSRAVSMTTLVNESLFGFIARVLFPALADYDRAVGSLRGPYIRCCKIITGVMWPAWAGLAAVATLAVIVLFGDKWASSGPVLSLLCIAQIILGAFPLHRDLFVIKGQTSWQMRLEPIYTVVALTIFFLGCLVSLEAAAASRILAGLVWMAIYCRPVLVLSGLSLTDLLTVYRESIFLAFAAALPALLITNFLVAEPALKLGVSVGLGTLAWAAAAGVVRHPIVQEFSVARLAILNALRATRSSGN